MSNISCSIQVHNTFLLLQNVVVTVFAHRMWGTVGVLSVISVRVWPQSARISACHQKSTMARSRVNPVVSPHNSVTALPVHPTEPYPNLIGWKKRQCTDVMGLAVLVLMWVGLAILSTYAFDEVTQTPCFVYPWNAFTCLHDVWDSRWLCAFCMYIDV